jgi:hypothetical protein
LARGFDDLIAELQAMLAETGQSNDFWTSTDLGVYVNTGLRVVSVYGRYEFVKGLEDIDESPTVAGNKVSLPDDFLRLSEPFNVTVNNVSVVPVNLQELRILEGNEFQKPSSDNVYGYHSGNALYIYPAPAASPVKIFYLKQQPTLTGTTEPFISEEGVDYALKYGFGMALCKGGLNVSAGMQLMQQVRQEIK